MERIALACRKLDMYYHIICLVYTFFFSVVAVAISSRCSRNWSVLFLRKLCA